ncbi:MAG: DUF4249 family protein [Flavobacteriales bacterium]|nr:DUF4249 family protein [Flavobacteriales bacterium]
MRHHPLTYLAAAALLAGCSNDLEINADYEDRTVVYGLLNQRDSVHFIKVNKAFLGEGNAYDMALVRDSSEYGDEDITVAEVHRLDGNGNVAETYTLRDTLVMNREPGDFYSPQQKLFYFTTPFFGLQSNNRVFLNQDASYRLSLVVNGKSVTSSTPIANDFTINNNDGNTGTQAGARVGLVDTQGQYTDYEFNWTGRQDDKRFTVDYTFRFDEIRGSDTLHRSFGQSMGTRIVTNSNGGDELAVRLNGQAFFSGLSAYIQNDPDWASVTKRIFQGMDFHISVANDDFHTYLTLSEPVSGIIEDRPAYSNVDGAVGVWGSRYNKSVIGKRLSTNTLEELKSGQYTGVFHFCSALDPGGQYSCD